jgi:hypothetical protein
MSDASRRMAAGDGRASRHPSRRKPSPLGRRLAPLDEVSEPGHGWFLGIGCLVAHKARWLPIHLHALTALNVFRGKFAFGILDLSLN